MDAASATFYDMDITTARARAAALHAELHAAAHHLLQAQSVEGRDLEAVLHEVDAQLEDTYAQLVELRRAYAKREGK